MNQKTADLRNLWISQTGKTFLKVISRPIPKYRQEITYQLMEESENESYEG